MPTRNTRSRPRAKVARSAQYRTTTDEAERKLYLKVLFKAVSDLKSGKSKLAAEAHDWLYNGRSSPHAFSAEDCCREVGLCLEAFLERIEPMSYRELQRLELTLFESNVPKPTVYDEPAQVGRLDR